MKFDSFIVSDLLSDISMGPFGSNIKKDCYVEEGVPYLNGSNLSGYALNETKFNYVSEEKADSLGRAVAHRGDVIVTHRGTLGQISYIPFDSLFSRYVTGNSQFRFTCNEKVLPEYLVYFFHTPLGQYRLLSNASQVGVPALGRPTSTFQKLKVEIPNVNTQKRICNIVGSIEKKIASNSKINDNLQQQAQALYRQMFINDADYSWANGKLSDIAEVTMGQSPSGSSYNEDGNGVIFFQGRAEFGFRFPSVRLYTTEAKRMASKNDTLMSVRAPVGDLNVAHTNCCIGRGLASIRSKTNQQSFILYTMFSLREQLNVFNGEGTVFGSINRNSLSDMPIRIPSADRIAEFESLASPMDTIIRNNYDENCRLEAIRNSLLPKLMSGELDVSEIDL